MMQWTKLKAMSAGQGSGTSNAAADSPGIAVKGPVGFSKHAAYAKHQEQAKLARVLDAASFNLQAALQGTFYNNDDRPEDPRGIYKQNYVPDEAYAAEVLRWCTRRGEAE